MFDQQSNTTKYFCSPYYFKFTKKLPLKITLNESNPSTHLNINIHAIQKEPFLILLFALSKENGCKVPPGVSWN